MRLPAAVLEHSVGSDLVLGQQGLGASVNHMTAGGRGFAIQRYSEVTVDGARTQVAYFVNSGSEANDMAMMIARLYSGNYDLLTLRNGYHGTSPSTMGLLSHSTWKFNTPQVGVWHAEELWSPAGVLCHTGRA